MSTVTNTETALQSPHLDLNNEVDLMQSLCKYIAEIHSQFVLYEEQGKEMSGCHDYKEGVLGRTSSKRLARFEGAGAEAHLSPKEKFRVETYFVVIDQAWTRVGLTRGSGRVTGQL